MATEVLDRAVPAWQPTTLRQGDALAFAVGPAHVFVSIYGEGPGGVFRSADDGLTWAPAQAGLPPHTCVTTLLWHAGRLYAGTVAHGAYVSADAGTSWAPVGTGLPPQATLFTLAEQGGLLLAGTEAGGVFRSTDAGAHWTPVNDGLPLDGHGLSIFSLVADRDDLFVSHPFGVHGSADGGTHWRAIGTGLPVGTALMLLALHEGHLFASSPGTLYRSADRGRSWFALSGRGWEQQLVRALAFHGDALYMGTQGSPCSGIFRSVDGGASWEALPGLPGAWSVNLVVARGYLLAGAGEHGVWRRPLPRHDMPADRPPAAHFHLAQNEPNPFSGKTAITYVLPRPEEVVLEICDLLGRHVRTLVDGPVHAGRHHVAFDASALPGGFYVCRLTVGTVSQSRQMLLLK